MASAIVAQWLHTCDADTEIDQTFTPRTAKGIRDQDGNIDSSLLFDFTLNFARRTIRIDGKQQRMLSSIHIGNVHAAVGADESVLCFGDEHAILAPDHG